MTKKIALQAVLTLFFLCFYRPLCTQEIPAQVHSTMTDFLRAFNSGASSQLLDFVRTSHHPQVLEQATEATLVNRLVWVYYQYGPLESQSSVVLNESSVCMWTRGTLTKTWVGIVFFHTKKAPHKITGIGVDRGIAPPPDKRLAAAPDEKSLKNRIRDYLNALKESPFFSGNVLIARNGKILLHQCTGWADVEKKQRIRRDTRFYIASVSKMFVASAILQLCDRGLLQADDPLSKFIPEYPRHIADQVTVHHLLTHTSGIELDEIPAFNAAEPRSIREMVDLQILYIPQVKELAEYTLPGEYNYTNEGYALLARIVEVCSGMEYWEYVKQHIFEPCGMKNTVPAHLNHQPVNTAVGYSNRRPGDGTFPTASQHAIRISQNSFAHPAGGIFSTTADLWAFSRRLFSGKLLSAKSLEQMTSLQAPVFENSSYGYGLQIDKSAAGTVWGHGGDKIGFNSRLDYYPESGYTVIVLCNKDQAAKNLADFVQELLYR
jgi:CubicO group peptidase (beta-lactamase class C family)